MWNAGVCGGRVSGLRKRFPDTRPSGVGVTRPPGRGEHNVWGEIPASLSSPGRRDLVLDVVLGFLPLLGGEDRAQGFQLLLPEGPAFRTLVLEPTRESGLDVLDPRALVGGQSELVGDH